MRRSRALSIALGTFFVAQSWEDCITNMAGFNLRQAQPRRQRATGNTESVILGVDQDQLARVSDFNRLDRRRRFRDLVGHEVRPPLADRPWTPEDEASLVELRASGLTWRLVARKLGRSEAAVTARARKLGSREAEAKEK